MKKKITIFVSSAGRKSKFIGIDGKGGAYPVVYFRKSKWATDREYQIILEYILDLLRRYDSNI